MSIYDFTVKDWQGQEVPLSTYRGQLLLVVNTATHCGFTPQYEGLQALHTRYHDQGLTILDFPSNQFGGQAPGSGEEIHEFCVSRYALGFPQFEKVNVNGEQASPLFVYLKDALPGIAGRGIKWNFTKFLIGRDGTPLKRYAPQTTPEQIEADIKMHL